MAIIKCPECDGKVSSTAKTCPHCGRSMTLGRVGLEQAKDGFGWIWVILTWIVLLGLILGMCQGALL